MPYLGNIPEIGELTEEKILFEFDKIPIILRLQENRHESWDIWTKK